MESIILGRGRNMPSAAVWFAIMIHVRGIRNAPKNLGCKVDSHKRILPFFAKRNASCMSRNYCRGLCAGNRYYGVEYGTECYCGNSLNLTQPGINATTGCNYSCSGAPYQTCGGSWRIQVYDKMKAEAPPGVSIEFLGCFGSSNVVPLMITASATCMSPSYCDVVCNEFPRYGVENGDTCFCLDSKTTLTPTPKFCSKSCTGLPTQLCGGVGVMDVYSRPVMSRPPQIWFDFARWSSRLSVNNIVDTSTCQFIGNTSESVVPGDGNVTWTNGSDNNYCTISGTRNLNLLPNVSFTLLVEFSLRRDNITWDQKHVIFTKQMNGSSQLTVSYTRGLLYLNWNDNVCYYPREIVAGQRFRLGMRRIVGQRLWNLFVDGQNAGQCNIPKSSVVSVPALDVSFSLGGSPQSPLGLSGTLYSVVLFDFALSDNAMAQWFSHDHSHAFQGVFLPLMATLSPSFSPSTKPTPRPTKSPTRMPTDDPSMSPSLKPTRNPTRTPTLQPTTNPSTLPPTGGPTPVQVIVRTQRVPVRVNAPWWLYVASGFVGFGSVAACTVSAYCFSGQDYKQSGRHMRLFLVGITLFDVLTDVNFLTHVSGLVNSQPWYFFVFVTSWLVAGVLNAVVVAYHVFYEMEIAFRDWCEENTFVAVWYALGSCLNPSIWTVSDSHAVGNHKWFDSKLDLDVQHTLRIRGGWITVAFENIPQMVVTIAIVVDGNGSVFVIFALVAAVIDVMLTLCSVSLWCGVRKSTRQLSEQLDRTLLEDDQL